MAGKHQIYSSKKSTRQKANRSWRRQINLNLKKVNQTPSKKVNLTRNKRVRKPIETTYYEDEGFCNSLNVNSEETPNG